VQIFINFFFLATIVLILYVIYILINNLDEIRTNQHEKLRHMSWSSLCSCLSIYVLSAGLEEIDEFKRKLNSCQLHKTRNNAYGRNY